MNLKPQDVMLVMWVLVRGWPRTYADLANKLNISPSEAHASAQRAVTAGLLNPFPIMNVNRTSAEEFLIHGLKYVFPAVRGPLTRGLPTSHAAAPLNRDIVAGSEDPPVWPDPEGEVRGYELRPLYSSVPKISKSDPEMYEWFALLDAIRSGRARERKMAEDIIRKRINARSGSQP